MFFRNITFSKLIILQLAICLLAVFLFSCEKKKETEIKYPYNKETIPTIQTYNDTMYLSDSGRIRFKVIAKRMLRYDQANDPYTLLPEKVYMEQYDSLKNIITTLYADSVWNYDKKSLWKLRGNVRIINSEGSTFDSEELFWDEAKNKIYSNLYVIIKEPFKSTTKAYGFESNQEMTGYTFYRATDADFYIYDNEDKNNEVQEEDVKKEK